MNLGRRSKTQTRQSNLKANRGTEKRKRVIDKVKYC